MKGVPYPSEQSEEAIPWRASRLAPTAHGSIATRTQGSPPPRPEQWRSSTFLRPPRLATATVFIHSFPLRYPVCPLPCPVGAGVLRSGPSPVSSPVPQQRQRVQREARACYERTFAATLLPCVVLCCFPSLHLTVVLFPFSCLNRPVPPEREALSFLFNLVSLTPFCWVLHFFCVLLFHCIGLLGYIGPRRLQPTRLRAVQLFLSPPLPVPACVPAPTGPCFQLPISNLGPVSLTFRVTSSAANST